MSSLKAQLKYPSFYIKDGDTLGVIISVKQAQKIDNDYDMLFLLKQSHMSYEKLDSAYIKVVSESGKDIAELKVKVSKLNEVCTSKDAEINNLKAQIAKYVSDEILAKKESDKKDTIIKNNEREITNLKTQRFLGFTVGGGGLIGIIVLLLLHK